MHTGQFRVVRLHRSRFLAGVVQNCWLALHCTVGLSLLQGCGGGSSDSSSSNSTPLKVTATSLPDGTTSVSYSATLDATGGTGIGYAWTVSGGGLRGGVSLGRRGVFIGTPSRTRCVH